MRITNYEAIGETLYEETLPNGLRICVVPKRGFQSSYAVFATDYGGAHRRFTIDGEQHDTPAGVAHYLEHKMFDLPNGDNALNLLSANGADANAFTSSDMTAYYFQSTGHFEENLRMLLHFVSTPYFTDETVQKEQGIISQEILMGEDDPDNAIYYRMLRMLFDHHPIRDRVVGTVESISHITAQTLYDCHKVFYAPSNMALCVEGDVDPDEIVRIAREELGDEKASLPCPDFGEAESLLPIETAVTEIWPVSAPQFLIGAKLRGEPKGPGALRQRLTATLSLRLLLGQSSPFYTRLYSDGVLNRDFGTETDFVAGAAYVLVGGESQKPEVVLDELKKAVQDLREHGLSPERFERAKRASLGARLRGLEDFESVCLSLVSGIFDGYSAMDAIAELSNITIADCERFLSETFSDERLAMVVFRPEEKGEA